ncbi:MAG: TatD family hydrolase [Lactobacillales bacterium]|jgi:TatD DNase family protein|nr:TatD family hydrolase [Lactobacillales bacterium]
MKYIDAHLHLLPDAVFLRAQQLGVSSFICNATSVADWKDVLALAGRINGVYPCLGVHPWFLEGLPDDWSMHLEALLVKNPRAMVGEIGLDRVRPDFEKQKQVFRRCLELADKHNRAVHIHCVRAWEDLIFILREFRDLKVLFHRFSGDEVLVQKLRFKDVYFSVMDRRVVDVVPESRLLVESDAPDGLKSPELIPDLVRELGVDPVKLTQTFDSFIYD